MSVGWFHTYSLTTPHLPWLTPWVQVGKKGSASVRIKKNSLDFETKWTGWSWVCKQNLSRWTEEWRERTPWREKQKYSCGRVVVLSQNIKVGFLILSTPWGTFAFGFLLRIYIFFKHRKQNTQITRKTSPKTNYIEIQLSNYSKNKIVIYALLY